MPLARSIVALGSAAELVDALRAAGLTRGGFLAVALDPETGIGVATHDLSWSVGARGGAAPVEVARAVEEALRPRWVWWNNATTAPLVHSGLRVAMCWDLAAVHRLLFGGWRADPARVWAAVHDLSTAALPGMGQLNLLDPGGDEGSDYDDPVRPDGYLRPEWVTGGWRATPERLAAWATVIAAALHAQRLRLAALADAARAESTARAESAAEQLCAELEADGLPVSVAVAEGIIGDLIGPRTSTEQEAAEARARRDHAVLELVPSSTGLDLRSPADVKTLLRRVGVEVSDTRAWRLEPLRDAHPVVPALLHWRKAERVATTYGYGWLHDHVGADGRLRGGWSGSDGAAGRMTAQAGLHNMPAEMRPAVVAEAGCVFIRADLGQIEPRVLAAVSGDRLLAGATQDDDMYAPVAARLGVERSVAKVAVLAAMYGQTSGAAGQALRGMESGYPVAMRYLRDAADAGQAGRHVRTYGGRLVRMWQTSDELEPAEERAQVASRGRFARNAMVQGAAAELFKAWAVTVRARSAALGARIVLCLHDELLVHAPEPNGALVAGLLDDCLQEAATRWAPDATVRFVADISTIRRWSDAKD